MKKIITHLNPDLDAIASCWLIKRFLPGWAGAEIAFVEAKNTSQALDIEGEILYVDVGGGPLDHHRQNDPSTCAAKKCWDFITIKRQGEPLDLIGDGAITQLVEVIRQIDNAQDLNWSEKSEARDCFYLHQILGGLKGLGEKDQPVVEFGFRALEAIWLSLKSIWRAKEELVSKAVFFSTPWGQAVCCETANEQFLWEAEKQNYVLAVKKTPQDGSVRMAARPDSKVDLAPVLTLIKKADPDSDWYLHPSHKLLLNHTSLNPAFRPTRLSLEEIIAIIRNQPLAEKEVQFNGDDSSQGSG
ncbi:MAG: chromate resistance protein ChrB domain-containing protein [Candidatus Shapirobacteria bacterium]